MNSQVIFKVDELISVSKNNTDCLIRVVGNPITKSEMAIKIGKLKGGEKDERKKRKSIFRKKGKASNKAKRN